MNPKHLRFIKCNTDRKRRHWLNPANIQIHLANTHERFPKKAKKNGPKEQKVARLQDARTKMNDKIAFFFSDVNLPHRAIESAAFKKVIEQAIDIGKKHKDATADSVASLSRRALTKNTREKADVLMKLLSQFLKNQLESSNWKTGRYLSVDCMIDGKGFGQKHAVGLTLVATQFICDPKAKTESVNVYSFVTELTTIKDNSGKTSSENADYIKKFTNDVLGEYGNHLKCIGDGAVVITYSNKLKDELLKQNNCKAMAQVLGVCNMHGHLLTERATWSRVIQETGNTKFATSIQFGKSYKVKNCKFGNSKVSYSKLIRFLSAIFR